MALRQRKAEPEPAAELGPAEHLHALELSLLAELERLSEGVRTEIDAARDAYRTQLQKPAPPDVFGGIWKSYDMVLQSLRRVRRDLVPGAPPPESRERQAVRDAESQLAHVTGLFEKSQALLASMSGARGEAFHQTVTRATDNRRAVQLAHQRLLDALRSLPSDEVTQDDRLRILELQSTSSDELTVTV